MATAMKLAKLAYRKVLEVDPGAWEARVNYGWILYLSGDFTGSVSQNLQVVVSTLKCTMMFQDLPG